MDFYQKFPQMLKKNYEQVCVPLGADLITVGPKVWKTVGDELIFSTTITSPSHLDACMAAFLRASTQYGSLLDEKGRHLDVKTTSWTAAFPAPNVTVRLRNSDNEVEIVGDELEKFADENPSEVDFLGNGIDCGFRLARFAAPDRCVLSAELAWLLATVAAPGHSIGNYKFIYNNRHSLKGVLKDRPYPIVFLYTERSGPRSDVRDKENALFHRVDVTATALRDFLRAFMEDEGIEFPVTGTDVACQKTLPRSYVDFQSCWKAEFDSLLIIEQNEKAATEDSASDGPDQIPEAVINQARQSISSS